jgi:ATP-dependent helicase/nuclease subunit A
VRQAVGADGDGVAFSSGSSDWLKEIPKRSEDQVGEAAKLPDAKPIRGRSTPSGAKSEAAGAVSDSPTGRAFGSEVHEVFEQVGWIDEEAPVLSDSGAGKLVAELLEVSEVRERFTKAGREVELHREQGFEVLVDGRWVSGIVDRLVVGEGTVEVIDFKTDAVDSAEVLVERYAGQMKAYRKVMEKLSPDFKVRCRMLSTNMRTWMDC